MKRDTVGLLYGAGELELDLTGLDAEVIRPSYPPALGDEAAAFAAAVARPIGGLPLRAFLQPHHRVAIAIPDITRALPTDRLLDFLFAAAPHLRPENVTVVSGTGTHRENTPDEWEHMIGAEHYAKLRCIDHDARANDELVSIGTSRFGYPVLMNRAFLEADRKILMGFIEPHFMAGFSGGYKACFPGVAGIESILHYHSADNIQHSASTWGVVEGNPTQDHVRAAASLVPDCFLINVTLDDRRGITGFFCGDPIAAHDEGCAFCKRTAMRACARPFPIVVTTNSGYPLDQNLYQAVKGMSAAVEVVAEGGLIIAVARCNDGFPAHGNFRRFLFEHDSVASMLDAIHSPGFRMVDQWQAQKLAGVLQRSRVALFSDIDPADVRKAHLTPIADVRRCIDEELARLGITGPLGILPEGPLTIPYLSRSGQSRQSSPTPGA